MREFFKPWRRKFGVVTISMACVFASIWFRSQYYRDAIAVNFERCSYQFGLDAFGLTWVKTKVFNDESQPIFNFVHSRKITTQFPMDAFDFYWFWKSDGLIFGRATHEQFLLEMWILAVPYWIVVVSLTLFSAYLLLSKPRSQAPKPSEQAPTTGA